jgi:hypothetical protein
MGACQETDQAKANEVEVRFMAEEPNRTRVELEHGHLDRHSEGWEGMRDGVGSTAGQRWLPPEQFLMTVVRSVRPLQRVQRPTS